MAVGDLPALGVVRYGKYTFSSDADTTDIRVTPVYDASGRTVTHSVYSITITDLIADNNVNTPVNVQAAIAELQKPGLPFRYENRGIGNLAINTGARASDVVWGPRVGEVQLKHLGGGRAVRLTWTVQVAIPTCDDSVFQFAVMEFVYKLTFKVSPNGDTTRIYSGHLKIPNRRKTAGGRDVLDSPHNYRDQVVPPLVEGFRRLDRTFEVSEDRSTLTFSITDEQMPPNVPPPGVTLCAAAHHFDSEGMAKWVGTIEAEYELLRGQGAFAAVVPFLQGLVKDRLTSVGKVPINTGLPAPAGGLIGYPTALVKFHVGEPTIYGPGCQRVKLSLSYLVAGIGLEGIIAGGGLWRPVPGSNWKLWAGSISTALSATGTAGLTWTANEDKLVDLCGHPRPVPTAPAPRPAVAGPPAPPPGWGVFGASPAGPFAGMPGFAGGR